VLAAGVIWFMLLRRYGGQGAQIQLSPAWAAALWRDHRAGHRHDDGAGA
jgi:hypothetical protein